MSNKQSDIYYEHQHEIEQGAFENVLTTALKELRDRIPESQKVADEALLKLKKLHG